MKEKIEKIKQYGLLRNHKITHAQEKQEEAFVNKTIRI